MLPHGTKQTSQLVRCSVAIGGKADIEQARSASSNYEYTARSPRHATLSSGWRTCQNRTTRCAVDGDSFSKLA